MLWYDPGAPLIREPVSSGLSKQSRCGSQETRHPPSWRPLHHLWTMQILNSCVNVNFLSTMLEFFSGVPLYTGTLPPPCPNVVLMWCYRYYSLVQRTQDFSGVGTYNTAGWMSFNAQSFTMSLRIEDTIPNTGLLWAPFSSSVLLGALSQASPGRMLLQ